MIAMHGIPALRAKLLRLQAAVEAAEPAAQRSVGEEVAEAARARVAVSTGETQASIEATTEGASAGGAAVYLEFGTYKMEAQPFMRPAADEASGEGAEAVFQAAIRGAV